VERPPAGPGFATDPAIVSYYERRAAEYDEWYDGRGLFASRDRPGWADAVGELVDMVRGIPPAATVDVACGTAFLTRHLRGTVIALDRSPAMALIARSRLGAGRVVVGDALGFPFGDRSVDRVFTAHFYGHLPAPERERFLRESRRVATELVVVDSARRASEDAEQLQVRTLNDGSTHRVFKRYLTAEQLAAEIGGEPVLSGAWFVGARANLD
jgi:ubiquinone/menaquinone biosynthesis C-methylase UbiE